MSSIVACFRKQKEQQARGKCMEAAALREEIANEAFIISEAFSRIQQLKRKHDDLIEEADKDLEQLARLSVLELELPELERQKRAASEERRQKMRLAEKERAEEAELEAAGFREEKQLSIPEAFYLVTGEAVLPANLQPEDMARANKA